MPCHSFPYSFRTEWRPHGDSNPGYIRESDANSSRPVGDGGSEQVYFSTPDELAALWLEFAEDIVKGHVATSPGTRPTRWWQFDAPEPRRRLGGIGTPCHERLAHVFRLYLGLPQDWITEGTLATYRAIDRPLEVPALSLIDPPMYEAQSTYLERLGLLDASERKRLKPRDFEPEPVTDYIDFESESED
jgi:hypothetical protein